MFDFVFKAFETIVNNFAILAIGMVDSKNKLSFFGSEQPKSLKEMKWFFCPNSFIIYCK